MVELGTGVRHGGDLNGGESINHKDNLSDSFFSATVIYLKTTLYKALFQTREYN